MSDYDAWKLASPPAYDWDAAEQHFNVDILSPELSVFEAHRILHHVFGSEVYKIEHCFGGAWEIRYPENSDELDTSKMEKWVEEAIDEVLSTPGAAVSIERTNENPYEDPYD